MNTIIGLIIFFVIINFIKNLFTKNSKSPFVVNDKDIVSSFIKKFTEKLSEGGIRHTSFNKFNKNTMEHTVNVQPLSRKNKKIVLTILGLIIGFIILINSIITIPSGNTGVQSLFGKVKDKELSEGLHFINPFMTINRMSIRTEEYTMSGTTGEGMRTGADQISALTKEGLSIDLDITIQYRLVEDTASEVYRKLGLNYQEKIIRPVIRSVIREIIAKYDAKDVYSEKRAEITFSIKESLVAAIEPRGILIEQVLLRNVILPDKLSSSIQAKLQSEQESQRYDFVLSREKKEADRKRIEAEGQRDAQKIINESLTPRYLQYLYINELKDRAGTIYIPTGNDSLPLFKNIQ